MAPLNGDSRPRLAPGCRLSEAEGQGEMLLLPEGALKLNPSALRIVGYCDGKRTLAEILALLRGDFGSTDEHRMEQETVALLEQLNARGAIRY